MNFFHGTKRRRTAYTGSDAEGSCCGDPDVRFSNRPFGVKRFQTIHHSVSVSSTGSCFSSESALGRRRFVRQGSNR
jgi:hypothetical protein